MRISLQLVVQDDGGAPATVTEIAQFERDGLDVGSLGLHLEEAKSLLGRLQRTILVEALHEHECLLEAGRLGLQLQAPGRRIDGQSRDGHFIFASCHRS